MFNSIAIMGYFGVTVIYLFAYNPGIMMTDSVSQWQQAHAMIFNNWHPVIDTLIIKFASLLYNAPISYV